MALGTRQSKVWSDSGVAYTAGEEVATAGEQPIAEIYNRAWYNATSDIQTLFNWGNNHSGQHENGGVDEISLAGLSIGSGANLLNPTADNIALATGTGTERWHLDMLNDVFTAFPALGVQLRLRNGLLMEGGTMDLGNSNLIAGSDTIWDSTTNSIPGSAVEAGAFVEVAGDTMTGGLGNTVNGAFAGALGGSNEALRFGSSFSDHLLSHTNGHGRVAETYNATWDSVNANWDSIQGGEPASFIGMNSGTPGKGASTGNITLAVAPATTNAGDPLTWRTVSFDTSGEFDTSEAEYLTLPDHTTSDPSTPADGKVRMWSRPDLA